MKMNRLPRHCHRAKLVKSSKFALILLACGLGTISSWSQTAVINANTLNYWAGVNTSNVLGAGSYVVTTTGGPTVNLSLSALSGLTSTLTPTVCTTATTNLSIVLAVTNAPAGANSLALSASGGASYTTNVNLFVVPQWTQTNGGSIGNWSDNTKWSGGATPSAGGSDSVYFESTIDVPYTNVVDVSRNLQSLVYIADQGSAGPDIVTVINSGITLSVLGTNGLYFGIKANAAKRPGFYFLGAGALVVSNTSANVAANSGSAASSANGPTINMTNLNTFAATVNRFGAGDGALNSAGLFGGELVNFWLAKTNTIKTSFSADYTALDFDCAFQYQCNKNISSGSLNPTFYLGLTNGIYTDSIGVGRAKGSSGVSLAGGGSTMRFAPAFANSVTPTASAYLRNTNGGRMSLLAVGVDSGLAGTALDNTIGTLDLRGGIVDVSVDQIWLGRNRTNALAGKTAAGAMMFEWGKINANKVILGNMQYTNGALVGGYLTVGTNGILNVNNNLELGHTPADNAGFPNALAAATGQMLVTNGGSVYASKISVGQFSTNNLIIVAPFSLLVATNGIASATNQLTTLNLNGGSLGFFVTAGSTNAYVTNLNTTTTASKINILSAPPGQSTNVLISYLAANQTPNISIGTLPAGFNNMQIVVDNLSTPRTISLVVSTNQPKNLVWRGGQNSLWDHISTNWLDTSLNAPTNVTKFTDGDSVTFNDAVGVPTSITIFDNVNPGQSGTGISVNTTTNSFVFNNSGVGGIGSCALVKSGTNSLEIDCLTTVGAQLNVGSLIVTNGGSVATATTAAGTTLTISSAGTVAGGVTCAGTLLNSGLINGTLNLQTPASAANSGTLAGSLSMQSGCTLNNSGNLNSIGSPTVPTNSILLNSGIIYGSSLTVSVGGTLIDTVAGSPAVSPGSINVGTLTINGTFNPGGTGNTIGSTKVTDYDIGNNQLGAPNGRVQLNAGSTTVFNFNATNAQPYTKLFSQSQVFGPSTPTKAINGCTLMLNNVGPTPFAAGNSFKLFGQYYTDGNMGNAGLNSTNSYPVIVPARPGVGLVWDLSQLYPAGIIGVIDAASVQIALTNTFTVTSSNIVTELSWPADFIGTGWVQQQAVALTNGLGTNWVNVGSSAYVNDILFTNTVSANTAVFYRFIRP